LELIQSFVIINASNGEEVASSFSIIRAGKPVNTAIPQKPIPAASIGLSGRPGKTVKESVKKVSVNIRKY
jgi:hypothetical protein